MLSRLFKSLKPVVFYQSANNVQRVPRAWRFLSGSIVIGFPALIMQHGRDPGIPVESLEAPNVLEEILPLYDTGSRASAAGSLKDKARYPRVASWALEDCSKRGLSCWGMKRDPPTFPFAGQLSKMCPVFFVEVSTCLRVPGLDETTEGTCTPKGPTISRCTPCLQLLFPPSASRVHLINTECCRQPHPPCRGCAQPSRIGCKCKRR